MTATSARVVLTAFSGLPATLDRFGVASDALLRQAGFQRHDFEQPDRFASFAQLDELLGHALRATGCEHLGLLLGRSFGLKSLGITGRVMLNAPTVRQALQDMEDFFDLQDNGAIPHVFERGNIATFSYSIHAAGVRNGQQGYDFAAVGMVNMLRELCGPDWRPDSVLLPRSRPRHLAPYRAAFEVPVRFDAMHAAVRFDAGWLDRPVQGANADLHRLLVEQATEYRCEIAPELHREVRRAIHVLLVSGNCSRATVAAHLRMHPRTLLRRLQDTGTTYQALLDDTRALTAKQLLHDTQAPAARIAVALGYDDPATFTRAFRRWTGLTPRQFRAAVPCGW